MAAALAAGSWRWIQTNGFLRRSFSRTPARGSSRMGASWAATLAAASRSGSPQKRSASAFSASPAGVRETDWIFPAR